MAEIGTTNRTRYAGINVKVLVILSSYRKKNTYGVIKRIETIHNGLHPCEYEYLFLKDLNLKACIGCHLCLTKGEQFCPCKDDRDLIIEKIESSDAVILASPNHTMNVNGLMKNLIDRLSYTMHRPRFFNQRFMVLITSGSYMGIKPAIKALSPLASGGKVLIRLGVMNSPGMNDSKKDKENKKIDKAAKSFARKLNKRYSFRPTLGNIMWFAAFKATSGSHPDEFPADFQYYHNKDFFVDSGLNIAHRNMIRLCTGFFTLLIKMGLV